LATHTVNLIPSAPPRALDTHAIKVACSNCNLRELCMPVGLSPDELKRIDEVVATRRKADRRSGASVPKARQAPLNSSILAIRLRISGVIWMVSVFSMSQYYTHLHPIKEKTILTPDYTHFIVLSRSVAEHRVLDV
jgi:hypothetical protein